MSTEAQTWALNTKVGDATRKLILWGLANHAHRDGRHAWASAATLADYGECSERTVQRHVVALLDQGLIREGDQSAIPDDVPKRYRPIVYDLAMSEATAQAWRAERVLNLGERRAASAAIGAAGGRAGAAARWPRGDNATPLDDRGDDVSPLSGDNLSPLNPAARGDMRGDTRGDTAASPKPRENLETKDLSQDRGRASRSADPDEQASGQQASTGASSSRRSSTSSAPKGHRLPEDWEPTPELIAEAGEDAPDVDQRREFRRFRDHWLGASGKGATKTRWDTAYRNWMRRAQDDLDERRPRGGQQPQPRRVSAADERLAVSRDLIARLEAQEREQEQQTHPRATVDDRVVTQVIDAYVIDTETTDQAGALF